MDFVRITSKEQQFASEQYQKSNTSSQVHLIGSPLALADSEYSKKAWVKFQDIPSLQNPSINIVIGTVAAVDCASKTVTTIDVVTKAATEHTYDYFVAASGLRRVWPVVPQSLSRKQYLVEAAEHIHAVSNAQHGVVVVGGGAVGIEMAAELKLVHPQIEVTLAHSRDKLLSAEALSDECKDTARELLCEAGVTVLTSHRLSKSVRAETLDGSTKYELEYENGHKMAASDIIMAVSQPVPTTTYMPSSALDKEGLVRIKPKYAVSSTLHFQVHHLTIPQPFHCRGYTQCRLPLLRRRRCQMERHQARRWCHAWRPLRCPQYSPEHPAR